LAFYAPIVNAFAFLAIVAVALALALTGALMSAGGRARLAGLQGQERHPIGWAAGVAAIAMVGSLFLSEVAHLVPCSFCWYQRIAMYPLVLILGIAAFRKDASVWRHTLPLALVGLAIAIYHVTIQWLPNLDVGACSTGASCTGRYVAVLGFISIPTMAGAAFLLIIALLLVVRWLEGAGGRAPDQPD